MIRWQTRVSSCPDADLFGVNLVASFVDYSNINATKLTIRLGTKESEGGIHPLGRKLDRELSRSARKSFAEAYAKAYEKVNGRL